jgi:hypothetical protein
MWISGLLLKSQGRALGSFCSSLSAAHNFSSVRVHRQAKGQARFTGAKNGPTPSQAFIPPCTSMASHFSSKQIGCRSRPCPVLSHETRGGEIGIVNKAVHVCLGLGNVLPVAISLRLSGFTLCGDRIHRLGSVARFASLTVYLLLFVYLNLFISFSLSLLHNISYSS